MPAASWEAHSCHKDPHNMEEECDLLGWFIPYSTDTHSYLTLVLPKPRGWWPGLTAFWVSL